MARREWDRAALSVCLLQRIPDPAAGQARRAAVRSGFRLTGLAPARVKGFRRADCETSSLLDEEGEHAVRIRSSPRDDLCDGLRVAGVLAPFPWQLRRHVHGYRGCGQGTASGRPAFLDLPGSER